MRYLNKGKHDCRSKEKIELGNHNLFLWKKMNERENF